MAPRVVFGFFFVLCSVFFCWVFFFCFVVVHFLPIPDWILIQGFPLDLEKRTRFYQLCIDISRRLNFRPWLVSLFLLFFFEL